MAKRHNSGKRGLELRATSFVGRILLGGITVTIHPKITGGPLLSLFRYAYGLRNLDLYGAVDFASSSWSFQDLLIHQLAAEASELLDRGIHRDYERVDSDLASPRGRIDFTRYLQTVQRAQTTLPCVHHPRMEDTLLNRVLLAGLHFAAGLAADGELKGHMRRLSKRPGEAVSEQRLDASLIAEAWRSMDRRTVALRVRALRSGRFLTTLRPAAVPPEIRRATVQPASCLHLGGRSPTRAG